ncbi:hypothetical protein [Streptomyces silvensis]|uniref:Uncharacterized protein n=1 Tax=Streptomyces silvensis TaxID=1765722 RepID=A0A0W7X1Z5_9ACTN|nr:hypothetical protein [Streptomyces silvensis]KUF16854.1 hypothetical protein AT728_23385 [Streptomyces silvensis]
MPLHATGAPTPDQIRQATRTLAHLAAYLRERPCLDEALTLLVPLLDADDDVPILLGDTLRSAERIITGAGLSQNEETQTITEALRATAQEATDWHVLQWDIQRVQALHQAARRMRPR